MELSHSLQGTVGVFEGDSKPSVALKDNLFSMETYRANIIDLFLYI